MTIFRIRSMFLICLVLTCCACSPCCWKPCPRIYNVTPNADPDNSFKVLFLSDGFTTLASLASYRSAVKDLVDKLLLSEPFRNYTDQLNFYRIDVLDIGPEANDTGILDGCAVVSTACDVEALTLYPENTPPTIESFEYDGKEILEKEFGVTLCYATPTNCESLGMRTDSKTYAQELAGRHGPGFDAVVVLANTQNVAGSGSFTTVGETALAIIGVELIPGSSVLTVSNNALVLFSHELGHTLGLLDEYPENIGSVPPMLTGSNVWNPTVKPWETAILISSADPIPWQSKLISPCVPADMEACLGSLTQEGCQSTINPKCMYYPSNPPQTLPNPGVQCYPLACREHPGAFEGAYYHAEDYYNAEYECRMEQLSSDATFCSACLLVIEQQLRCFTESPPGDCLVFDSGGS